MQATLQPKNLLVCLLATSLLAACGGSSQEAKDTKPTKTTKPDGKYALVQAGSQKAFTNYMRLAVNNMATHLEKASVDTSGGAVADAESNNFGVSETNLIEAGVDEADFAKQNTTHLYTTGKEQDNNNYIYAYAKPDTNKISSVALSNQGQLKGFFIKNDELFALNQVFPAYTDDKTMPLDKSIIALDVINISTPTALAVSKTHAWEGVYQTSRRIADAIYVISDSSIYTPWACAYGIEEVATVEGLSKKPAYCTQPKQLSEEELATRMPVDINGEKINPADCYIPKNYSTNSKINTNITLITKIDTSGKHKHKTTCIAASAEHIYMSPNSLYLAGLDYNDIYTSENQDGNLTATLINKFNLTEGDVSYAGSGKVKGYINWSTPSFSMNEYQGVLRVVTSQWQNNKVHNMLHTLKEAPDALELTTLASLPNEASPQPIGKPNETIRGIRFLANEGYIVTFEQTDPLYKVDLTDPSNPKILGALEMQGYSAYLHRINEKYLLGIGFSATEEGQITGLQTTVFDTISEDPKIIDQKSVFKPDSGWLDLPVAADSRAITTLKNSKKLRVAIPYKINNYTRGGANYMALAEEYEIDLATGKFLDSTTRKLQKDITSSTVNSSLSYFWNNHERALIDGDDLYYSFFDGGVIKHIWGQT